MSTDSPAGASDLRRPDLDLCQAKLGYRFLDPALLEAALTHASGVQHRLASNERMEFLGDAILGMVVCERLFDQYPEYSEGELTTIKSVVVTCARLADALCLNEHLILGKGMAADPRVPRSVLAAAFESLVAAIYMDGGMAPAQRFILDHVAGEIEAAVSSEFGGNFKSLLQQLSTKKARTTPSVSRSPPRSASTASHPPGARARKSPSSAPPTTPSTSSAARPSRIPAKKRRRMRFLPRTQGIDRARFSALSA
jgi:ribonuclease-3